MKKQFILAGLLAVGFASAQTDKAHLGKVGINIMTPQATIDIRPNDDNGQETATTNEGILIPKLSKTRVANIEDTLLVEGTLVYVTDDASSTIASYVGSNAKVAKITEKGYYFYNGTEWVKTSYTDATGGSKWMNDAIVSVVKLTNLSDGITSRTDDKNIFVTDTGNVGIGQIPDSTYRLDVPETSRFKDIVATGWITHRFSQPIYHQISNSTANSTILFNQMWSGAFNNYAVQSNDEASSYAGQLYFRADNGQLGFRLTTQKLDHGADVYGRLRRHYINPYFA